MQLRQKRQQPRLDLRSCEGWDIVRQSYGGWVTSEGWRPQLRQQRNPPRLDLRRVAVITNHLIG